MKTLILGLGNTILSDDGVGIYVARRTRELLGEKTSTSLTIQEASVGGFNFIDILAGFDKAVIIDAIHSKAGIPGEFYELDISCLKPSVRISSLHGIDIATACDMANKLAVDFPKEIKIFVMEVEDEFSFGEKCTQHVENAIPKMANGILEVLKEEGWL